MLKVIIVDDDSGMRLALHKALERYEALQVAAEAATGEEAVERFLKEPCDIAFLDVDMPGMNGVEAAKLILDISPKCAIVFVTAHDDYMKEAFELFAFDYIVKPFKLSRLEKTVDRLIEEKTAYVAQEKKELKAMGDDLLLKVKDGMVVVKKEDIIFVERENRQTVIVTTRGEFVISKTLQEVEGMLGGEAFLHSHKSYIIRIDAIKSLQVYGRWTYIVKFEGTDHDALLTKEKAKTLESLFTTLN